MFFFLSTINLCVLNVISNVYPRSILHWLSIFILHLKPMLAPNICPRFKINIETSEKKKLQISQKRFEDIKIRFTLIDVLHKSSSGLLKAFFPEMEKTAEIKQHWIKLVKILCVCVCV